MRTCANPAIPGLNQYSYVPDPLGYTDPTGHDPLDLMWQSIFSVQFGRDPDANDISITCSQSHSHPCIRMIPSTIARTVYRWIMSYTSKILNGITWNDMPVALYRLRLYYLPGEELFYSRDVGTLFAGLRNRFEEINGFSTVSEQIAGAGPAFHPSLFIGRGAMPPELAGGDADANVHHWAWSFTMGAQSGLVVGLLVNFAHEAQDPSSGFASDIPMGSLGVLMGHMLTKDLGSFRRFQTVTSLIFQGLKYVAQTRAH